MLTVSHDGNSIISNNYIEKKLTKNMNNVFYYINTNEISGELSRENMISSHVKITCYFHV